MIEVEQKEADGQRMLFNVTVSDTAGTTHHRVTMTEETYQRLTAGAVTPQACIEAAFRFLIEREAKTDLMTSFDLNVLQMSYASFERDFHNYL